uniref:Predicted protein n=1 Tax=Hordeum vulgare subsp. vulgare TaxID=112509 RepID=F2DSV9_HORVV|nr:predicted protein [Hordeum vulgare subsp. vulgare]
MKSNGIDPAKVKAAFDESFSKEDNKYLKASREHLASAGVNKFPAVSINGQKVRGSLNAELIFDDVCNTLLSPP